MSNFCQEYRDLLDQLESLKQEVQGIFEQKRLSKNIIAEVSKAKNNIHQRESDIDKQMNELLASTAIVPTSIIGVGQEVMRLEIAGLQIIEDEIGSSIENMHINIEDHHVTDLDLFKEAKFTNLRTIKLFKKLNNLYIGSTKVEDISDLAYLTELKKIQMEGIAISDFSVISSLSKLQTLMLNETKIKDISIISNLLELNTLELSSTKVEDIRPLINLRKRSNNFQWVWLRGTPAAKDPSQKENIDYLKELGVNVYYD